MSLSAFIAQWGIAAVFLGCFFEGETAAILGGVIAHRGLTGWGETALAAFLGALLADQLWFLLARALPAESRAGRWLKARSQSGTGSALFRRLEQNHIALTLAFRFIPGTRILGPLALGRSSMSWPGYSLWNSLSCLVWAVLFTGLGYHFGQAAEAGLGRLHEVHFLGLLLVVALAGLILARLCHHLLHRR
ncbi:DedA family protein [Pseudogemmobacter faecipullorum]|uniref:VTT domain-containing protein n=1 Tax=Pseudogemmobacter faecipullorum TaxID=2755041 RepID=A0ABS8CLE7_9RHOB|nr:VTT domain-containing protein [Pseudogemmobacter faecipullorum]MCB5409700.1 VTT domain-containing protein [Pseudogemmobacter faecipullorum]